MLTFCNFFDRGFCIQLPQKREKKLFAFTVVCLNHGKNKIILSLKVEVKLIAFKPGY
jgi:hypothetical protein